MLFTMSKCELVNMCKCLLYVPHSLDRYRGWGRPTSRGDRIRMFPIGSAGVVILRQKMSGKVNSITPSVQSGISKIKRRSKERCSSSHLTKSMFIETKKLNTIFRWSKVGPTSLFIMSEWLTMGSANFGRVWGKFIMFKGLCPEGRIEMLQRKPHRGLELVTIRQKRFGQVNLLSVPSGISKIKKDEKRNVHFQICHKL